MKRDMDLARQIMLQIESAPYKGGWVELELPEHSDEELSYHIMLLAEAGLIEATNTSHLLELSWKANRLTWEGHEFLEAARDESRWEKAKALIRKTGSGVVFPILKELLVKLASEAVFKS